MGKILFMTNIIRQMGMMQRTLENLQREGKMSAASSCRWISDSTCWDEKWQRELQGASLLFIKWMGTGLDTPFLKSCLECARQCGMRYYFNVDDSDEGAFQGGLSAGELELIKSYFRIGGERNFTNLWLYLDAVLQGGEINVPAPDPVHWCGIYHPRSEKIYTDFESYKRDFCVSGRATAGMFFYRDEWVWGDLSYQAAMIEALEKQGMNVICVFTYGMPIEALGRPSLPRVVEMFFCEQGGPVMDVLLNTMKFSLTGSGALTLDYLRRWNVPVLEPYTIMATYDEWKNSFEGMNAMEVSISISMPEFDGIIHGVPIACKKLLENGEVRYLPMAERIERMASRAAKWTNMRRKTNAA